MNKIINQKLKLLVIYNICALLPVLAIFFYFYQDIYNRMEKELLFASHQSLTRIAGLIDDEVNQALNLSNRIYMNEELYIILERIYTSPSQYLRDYQQIIEPAMRGLPPVDSRIKYYSIFVDNPTIFNSNLVQRIDMPLYNGEWTAVADNISGTGSYIYSYGKYYPHLANGTLFSYIRSMNLYKNTGRYKKIIKIDLEPDLFRRVLESEDFSGNIDIVDDNQIIICSTQAGREWQKYESIKKDEKYIQKCTLDTLEGWQVIGAADVDYIKHSLNTQRNFAVLLLCASVVFMVLVIYRLVNAIFAGRLRETEIVLQKKQAELNALRNQVDPHFLFNILETIRMKLLLSGQKEHSNVVMRMARLYRDLMQWEDDIVSLSEEAEFIREFMFIQEYRYDDALVWTMTVDDDALDFKIPKMLLHTFIENACKHGMNENGGKSRIDICIKMRNGFLCCRIKDNGSGFPTGGEEVFYAMLEGRYENPKGIGIYNAIQRLRLYYGGRFKLTLDTCEGCGTAIEIVLPPMGAD